MKDEGGRMDVEQCASAYPLSHPLMNPFIRFPSVAPSAALSALHPLPHPLPHLLSIHCPIRLSAFPSADESDYPFPYPLMNSFRAPARNG